MHIFDEIFVTPVIAFSYLLRSGCILLIVLHTAKGGCLWAYRSLDATIGVIFSSQGDILIYAGQSAAQLAASSRRCCHVV